MIEAIAMPVLVKAIDFLFDESKKVLEERPSFCSAHAGKAGAAAV